MYKSAITSLLSCPAWNSYTTKGTAQVRFLYVLLETWPAKLVFTWHNNGFYDNLQANRAKVVWIRYSWTVLSSNFFVVTLVWASCRWNANFVFFFILSSRHLETLRSREDPGSEIVWRLFLFGARLPQHGSSEQFPITRAKKDHVCQYSSVHLSIAFYATFLRCMLYFPVSCLVC